MHQPIHNLVKHKNWSRNKTILDYSPCHSVSFTGLAQRLTSDLQLSSARWLTSFQYETGAMGLPTRITNNAGATKAQIAPFSSESQQLQRKIE